MILTRYRYCEEELMEWAPTNIYVAWIGCAVYSIAVKILWKSQNGDRHDMKA